MRNIIEKHPFVSLFIVHLAAVLLRCLFVIYGNTDLHFEEAQYWTWSQHLDWSYYSKPPMVAVLNYLSESLFGHSELSVRINAILFGFLISIVTYLFTQELFKDKLKAFLASILVYAMPFYQGSSLFFSTDAPLLFFAIWALYLGWIAITYDKWKYWILFAVALGLGYLSKYAMLFFIPSTLCYIFIKERQLFRNKKLYISLLISLLFFLPIVIWNFKYDFIGLKHIIHLSGAARSLPEPMQVGLLEILEYIGGQLAIISPFFLVMYFNAFRKFKLEKKVVYLWLPALLIFLVFLGVSITKGSAANVNWTMFAYIGFPILLAHYVIEAKKLRMALALLGLTLSLLMMITNMQVLDKVGMGKIFPAQADPLKRLVGWEELAKTVDSIENLQTTKKVFVFSDTYHTTSELRFYSYPKVDYYYANMGNRMTQFNLWKGIEQFENQNYTGIFITDSDPSGDEQAPPPLPTKVAAAFDKKYEYYSRTIYYRGEPITRFNIYVLRNFKNLPTNTENY